MLADQMHMKSDVVTARAACLCSKQHAGYSLLAGMCLWVAMQAAACLALDGDFRLVMVVVINSQLCQCSPLPGMACKQLPVWLASAQTEQQLQVWTLSMLAADDGQLQKMLSCQDSHCNSHQCRGTCKQQTPKL